jgi:hypothetical protein
VDLAWRRDGQPDQVIVSTDSPIPPGSDAGTPGEISIEISGPAVPSNAGDLLVNKVKMTSGSSAYTELFTYLAIP